MIPLFVLFGNVSLNVNHILKMESSKGNKWKNNPILKGLPEDICIVTYGNPYTKETEHIMLLEPLEAVTRKVNEALTGAIKQGFRC